MPSSESSAATTTPSTETPPPFYGSWFLGANKEQQPAVASEPVPEPVSEREYETPPPPYDSVILGANDYQQQAIENQAADANATILPLIQRAAIEGFNLIGHGLFYTGALGFFCLAVAGTVSVDITTTVVVHRHIYPSAVLAGWLFDSVYDARNDNNWQFLLISLPIISAAAIGLLFMLGVAEVAQVLLVGWFCAMATLAAGAVLICLAEMLETVENEGMALVF